MSLLPKVSIETVNSVQFSVQEDPDYLVRNSQDLIAENPNLAAALGQFTLSHPPELQMFIRGAAVLCYTYLRSQAEAEEMLEG